MIEIRLIGEDKLRYPLAVLCFKFALIIEEQGELLRGKVQLRKRVIVETIIDQLKNTSQNEHTRHRSPINLLINASAV